MVGEVVVEAVVEVEVVVEATYNCVGEEANKIVEEEGK